MHSRTLSRHALSRLLLAVVLLHALLGQPLHQALHLRADANALGVAASGIELAGAEHAAFAPGAPADGDDEEGGGVQHEGMGCAWCLAHADSPLLGGSSPTPLAQAAPQPQLAQPTPGVRVPTPGFSPFAPRGPPAAVAAFPVSALT